MELGKGKNGIEYMIMMSMMILVILIKVQIMLDLSWVVLIHIHILAGEEQDALLAKMVSAFTKLIYFSSGLLLLVLTLVINYWQK